MPAKKSPRREALLRLPHLLLVRPLNQALHGVDSWRLAVGQCEMQVQENRSQRQEFGHEDLLDWMSSATESRTWRTHSLMGRSPAKRSSMAYSPSVTLVPTDFVRRVGMSVLLLPRKWSRRESV
jgi:hypothetical protein